MPQPKAGDLMVLYIFRNFTGGDFGPLRLFCTHSLYLRL